jgi:ATP-binding cassette subfamily C protein CydC
MKDLLRLITLFKPYLGWMALGVLLSLITILANVSLMAIAGWFISMMAIAGLAGVSANYFTPAALIRGAAIARTAGRYGERLVTHEATFRLLAELRVWFYEKIEPLAPAGLEQYRSGDILSRIRADIDTLNNVYLRILVPIAVAFLATIIFIIILAFFDPLLALIEFILLLIAGVIVPWLMNRLGHSTGQAITQNKADMRANLVGDLQGMGELLVYGAAEQHATALQTQSETLAQHQKHMARLSGFSQAALGLCANLAMWGMLIVAIPQVSAGTLARPELAMLAFFALASFEAVTPLPLAFQSLGETLSALRRIFSLADTAIVVSEPDTALPMPSNMDFTFQNLGFAYQNTPALQDINIHFPAGKKIAIVGATGSGKTTLSQLLLKFREPQQGSLLLAGKPLSDYDGEQLRQQIAVVPQHTHLFNGTILDNLKLAKPNASQTDIEIACETALIHDFIRQQPDRYQTETGETGIKVSGGQAKRIAIARALLKQSPILLLDEPTEGLDPETARQLMQNLLKQATECQQSLFMITHRLNHLDAFDEIIVLDKGRIIEQGKHTELLAQNGAYAELVAINKQIATA